MLSLGWLLPLVLLLFIATGWIMAILTVGLFWIFGQRVTFLIWAVPYLVLPLSAPWYPVSVLPIWAQYVAYCLPTTYLFEGVRKIAAGSTMPVEYLVISSILTLVYIILTILFFNKMFKKSREKGLAHLEQE
jgi:ABC-2 type transport system permease protein